MREGALEERRVAEVVPEPIFERRRRAVGQSPLPSRVTT